MDGDMLKRLGELARQQIDLEDQIKAKEEELKRLKAEHQQVSGDYIPSVLDEAGLSEVRLSDGTKVVVKQDMRVSTAGKYRDIINRWLQENGHGDVIKNELSVGFPAGDERVKSAVEALRALGVQDMGQKEFVEPSTFKSLVRELMEDGEEIPLDDLGVHTFRTTKLDRA